MSAVLTARDTKMDVAKGVLVALVVWGHLVEKSGGPGLGGFSGWVAEPQRSVMSSLNLFVMPVFVLLAGTTSRRTSMVYRAVQMATVLVVFQAFYLALDLLGGDGLGDHPLNPFYALWFLMAMVWWQLTLPLVERFPRVALALSVVLAVAAGLLPFEGWIGTWARTAQLWFFFVVGRLYGARVVRSSSGLSFSVRAGAAGVLVALMAAYLVSGLDPAWLRANESFSQAGASAGEGLLGRSAAFVMSALAGWCVLVLLPVSSRLLEVVGRRSLAVYVFHVGGILVAEVLLDVIHPTVGNGVAFAATVVLAVVGTAVLAGFPQFEAVVRAVGCSVADRLPSARSRRAAQAQPAVERYPVKS